MQFSQLFADDERAVTPVIGIVLMVAVAVILAALIAPELLSISRNSGEAGPQVVVQFDYDASATGDVDGKDSWGRTKGAGHTGLLTFSHESGEPIPADRLTLVGVSGLSDKSFTTPMGTDRFEKGETLTVWVNEGDTVRIVWDSREGTKTTAVAVWND
jgi:flagellin-like protein